MYNWFKFGVYVGHIHDLRDIESNMAAPKSPHLSSSSSSEVSLSRHTGKCTVCSHFIPAWETHGLCYKHRKDCASNHTCDICKNWPMERWTDLVTYVRKCLDKQKEQKSSTISSIKSKNRSKKKKAPSQQQTSLCTIEQSQSENHLAQEEEEARFDQLYNDMYSPQDPPSATPTLSEGIVVRGDFVSPFNDSGQFTESKPVKSNTNDISLEPQMSNVIPDPSLSVTIPTPESVVETQLMSILKKFGLVPTETCAPDPNISTQVLHVPSFQPRTDDLEGPGKPSSSQVPEVYSPDVMFAGEQSSHKDYSSVAPVLTVGDKTGNGLEYDNPDEMRKSASLSGSNSQGFDRLDYDIHVQSRESNNYPNEMRKSGSNSLGFYRPGSASGGNNSHENQGGAS